MSVESPVTSGFWKYGHIPWTDSIRKATNGRVDIEVFPMQTLVQSKDAYEAVKSGIVDVTWIPPGVLPGQFALTEGSVALPFLFPSAKVGSRTSWALHQKYPELQNEFPDVKMLIVFTTDPYTIITRDKEIKVLEDFKGLKLRALGGPSSLMVTALGAVPVQIPMPENYLNLQKGVIDGMPAPAEAISSFRLYEVTKYRNMATTLSLGEVVFMSKKVWASFPADVQNQVMSVSGEVGAILYGEGVFDRTNKELAEFLKAQGKEYIEYMPPQTELDRWVAAGGKPVWESWIKQMEDRGKTKARAIVEDAVTLSKQFAAEK